VEAIIYYSTKVLKKEELMPILYEDAPKKEKVGCVIGFSP
jgi:hypothetical protein